MYSTKRNDIACHLEYIPIYGMFLVGPVMRFVSDTNTVLDVERHLNDARVVFVSWKQECIYKAFLDWGIPVDGRLVLLRGRAVKWAVMCSEFAYAWMTATSVNCIVVR